MPPEIFEGFYNKVSTQIQQLDTCFRSAQQSGLKITITWRLPAIGIQRLRIISKSFAIFLFLGFARKVYSNIQFDGKHAKEYA